MSDITLVEKSTEVGEEFIRIDGTKNQENRGPQYPFIASDKLPVAYNRATEIMLIISLLIRSY